MRRRYIDDPVGILLRTSFCLIFAKTDVRHPTVLELKYNSEI